MPRPTTKTRSPYAAQRLAEVEAEKIVEAEAEAQREAERLAPHPVDPLRRKDGKFTGGVRTAGSWKPGQSGNRAGKPVGSRALLSHGFVKDLSNLWRRKGREILEQLAVEQPAAVAALAAKLLPADVLDRVEAVEHEGVTKITRIIITPHGPESRPALPEPARAEPAPLPEPAVVEPLRGGNGSMDGWERDSISGRLFRPLPEAARKPPSGIV